MNMKIMMGGAALLALGACGDTGGNLADEGAGDASMMAIEATAIPESLAPFGDGYPAAGDACRRLGESPATADYLDDSAVLVGCPTAADAAALDGEVVGSSDGVTIVSIPMGDADAGMASSEDALVPGTDYNATTQVDCGFGGSAPNRKCDAGVKRGWGDDGTTLVEVTRADGSKRALFFNGTTPTGADSSQADGSAGWDFKVERSGDVSTIRFGPETYVIVDALVEGG